MTVDACPTDSDLVKFALGTLSESMIEAIALHLDSCTACEKQLSNLESKDDPLIAGLRKAAAIEPAPTIDILAQGRLGEYVIVRELGRGGMGIVYEAEQVSLGRRVALKILPRNALLDKRAIERFQREARSAGQLHHSNIVPVFGTGEEAGLHYFAMQYIPGSGLDIVIRELRNLRDQEQASHSTENLIGATVSFHNLSGVTTAPSSVSNHGPIPYGSRAHWVKVARLGLQVGDALAYAHSQGVLHRDIKPSNLLLDPEGTVWITDFGLAKGDSEAALTYTGDLIGTLRYAPPERFRGQCDQRGDIYSLGLTLYELLTLQPAFAESDRNKLLSQVMNEEPRRPRAVNPKIPRDLETIVLKAIAREPAHRYTKSEDLANDLRRFLEDRPIQARRANTIEQLSRWCRREPRLALMSSAFVLSMLLGIAGITWKWQEAESEKANVTNAEKETKTQRDRALDALKTSQLTTSKMMLDRGLKLAESGNVHEGLHWMIEALKNVPVGENDLERVIRSNLASWPERTHQLRLFKEYSQGLARCLYTPDEQNFLILKFDRSLIWNDRAKGPTKTNIFVGSSDGKAVLLSNPVEQGPAENMQIYDLATGEPQGNPMLQTARILDASFSRDGKRIVTLDVDRILRVWDAEKNVLLREDLQVEPRPKEHGPIESAKLVCNRDASIVLVAINGADIAPGFLDIFDLRLENKVVKRIQHPAGITSLVLSPDESQILTGGCDHTAKLSDIITGQTLNLTMKHPNTVNIARYTPDGRWIVTGGDFGIALWNTQAQFLGIIHLNSVTAYDIAFSADGERMLVAGSYDKGYLYQFQLPCSLASSRENHHFRNTDQISWMFNHFAHFSPDGTKAITGGPTFARWQDVATGQPIHLFRHTWPAADVTAISPDGRWVATSSRDRAAIGDVQIWNTTTGLLQATLPKMNYTSQLVFSPDSQLLATGGYDCTIRFWDPRTGMPRGTIVVPDIVIEFAFSHDGKTLAVGHSHDYSGSTGIVLCDVSQCKRIGSQILGPCITFDFSPDDKTLVTGHQTFVQFWDAQTGLPKSRPFTESAMVHRVLYSPEGESIAVSENNGSLHLRRAENGEPIGAPMPYTASLLALAFNPDQRYIAAGYADGVTKLWDTKTQQPIGPPIHHDRPIIAISFSPDSKTLLTCIVGGTVRCWPVPQPTLEDLEQLTSITKLRTGLQMNDRIHVYLKPDEWNTLAPLKEKLGSSSNPLTIVRSVENFSDRGVELWHLDRWHRDQPKEALPLLRRGRLQALLDHPEKAHADLKLAESLTTPAAVKTLHRAESAQARFQKKWDLAQWHLDQALAIDPSDWQLHLDQAEIHEAQGMTDAMESDWEASIKYGADRSTLIMLSDKYAEKKAWSKAANVLAKAAEQGPIPLDASSNHALAFLKLGDRAGYRRLCQNVLVAEDIPIYANVNAILTLGPNGLDDYRERIAQCKIPISVKGRPIALLHRSQLLVRAGRYQEAIADLNDALHDKRLQESVTALSFLAIVQHHLGDQVSAKDSLEKARALPIHPQYSAWDRLEIDMILGEVAGLLAKK